MDQYIYTADPRIALALASQRHHEEIKRAEWRNARHVEELKRSRMLEREAASATPEEIAPRPAAAWFSWRGILASLRIAGAR